MREIGEIDGEGQQDARSRSGRSMYHLGRKTAKEKGHRSGEHESTARHIHGYEGKGTVLKARHPAPVKTNSLY